MLTRARAIPVVLALFALVGELAPARALPAESPSELAQTPLDERPGRAEPMPPEKQGIGIDERSGQPLPLDLTFTNEMGKAVALRDYFDGARPVVLQLSYFECPMLCGLVSEGLLASLEALSLDMGVDYRVINLSFDPSELPEVAYLKKKNFVEAFDRADPAAWHFLTGEQPAIDALTAAVGFRYKWVEAQQQFSHPAAIIVLTPDGTISRYLYGVRFDARTLRLSLVEASEGKVGTTLDKFLLACFHFDGRTGRYALAAMNLMRAGALLTVVVVAVVVLRLLRRERSARAIPAAPTGRLGAEPNPHLTN